MRVKLTIPQGELAYRQRNAAAQKCPVFSGHCSCNALSPECSETEKDTLFGKNVAAITRDNRPLRGVIPIVDEDLTDTVPPQGRLYLTTTHCAPWWSSTRPLTTLILVKSFFLSRLSVFFAPPKIDSELPPAREPSAFLAETMIVATSVTCFQPVPLPAQQVRLGFNL